MLLQPFSRFEFRKTPRTIDSVLRSLVSMAYRDVPVYRHLWEGRGNFCAGFRGIQDLPKLPVAERGSLFLESAVSERMSKHFHLTKLKETETSGSHGIPVKVQMSQSEGFFRKLQLLRAWGQAMPLRFPLTVLDLGARLDPCDGIQARWHGPVHLIRVPILSQKHVVMDAMRHACGSILSGYPSGLVWLEETLGSRACDLQLKMIAARGEILHDEVRKGLEATFGCRVFDFYNCEEVGNVAWQCPANASRMHVNTDSCIVEVVNEEGKPLPQGEEGRIIVTNLYNWTMPMIRYDLQDRGWLLSPHGDRCACGSTNPTIGIVEGRDDDFLLLPDGTLVSPRLAATRFDLEVEASRPTGYHGPLHRGFQIVQDTANHLTIRVVPAAGIGLAFEARVLETFGRILPGLQCTIVAVAHLPSSSTGKFRKVVRQIDGPRL